MVVNLDDHDHDLIAHVRNVFGAFDVVFRQFAHAHQALTPSIRQVHEYAGIHNAGYCAGKDRADLEFRRHSANSLCSLFDTILGLAGYDDGAVIGDIYLRFSFFLNLADYLAAGADYLANLFRIDLDGNKPRRKVG